MSNQKLSRRGFVGQVSAAVAATQALPSILGSGVAQAAANNKTLVVVFLRGGADALSLVPPVQTDWADLYRASRPNIAIPVSATSAFADGNGWRLHPAFVELKKLWNNNELAILMGTGSPNHTRSHFVQQDLIEAGNPMGQTSSSPGYLARALEISAGSGIGGVSISQNLALALTGHQQAVAIGAGPEGLDFIDTLGGRGFSIPTPITDRLRRGWVFEREGLILQTGRQAVSAIEQISASQPIGQVSSEADYKIPQMRNAVGLMLRLPTVRYVTVDIEGWDTHANMGTHNAGNFQNLVGKLDAALATMRKDLNAAGRWDDTCVVVMTEFGRPLQENGNSGLDHGRGGAAFVLGKNMQRGVYTADDFSLNVADLEQGRDLKVTIDYRQYLTEVFKHHMGLTAAQIESKVFPGFSPNHQLSLPIFS
jgi:uncharacterized protein (DUF1501 family)